MHLLQNINNFGKVYKALCGKDLLLTGVLSYKDVLYKHIDNTTDHKKLFIGWITTLGGRLYNSHIDYGLFAIKLRKACKESEIYDKNEDCYALTAMVSDILFCDRHDLYQNIVYSIDRLTDIEDRWRLALIALVDSINLEGSGDVTHRNVLDITR